MYIFTTDHGGSDDTAPYDDPTVKLYLWGESITDSSFATQVNKVTTMATVAIFEQCFSGGMIDNLEGSNRVLISASRFWELSYAMSSTYDEFSYYATYALANPTAADANGDSVVSMEEAYFYALANDSRQSESLDGDGDNEGEHPSYYSNPWDLGRRVSLNGIKASVSSPVYAEFTQSETSESFPSGGTAKNWQGDDGNHEYSLPFDFPFCGTDYNKIWVSTNGLIFLDDPGSTSYYQNSVDGIKGIKAIAPLWDDLTVLSSDGDDIYVTEDTYWVTIRWAAHTYRDDRPVNFAVKLGSSGAIRFLYGTGNDHTSRVSARDKTIGVSQGNSSDYHLCLRNGRGSLSNASPIEFNPYFVSDNKVLYFCDQNEGDNPFPTALSQLSLNTTTATSYSDFETKVGTGEYQLVIAFIQNYNPGGGTRPSSLPNFESFLNSGGKAIFTDWYQQSRMATYFGVIYADPDAGTSCSTGCNDPEVAITASFLKTAVGDVMSIRDPGWTVFAYGMTLNGAQEAAHYTSNGYVAIAYTENRIINGPLKDTFQDFSEGLELAKAEINRLNTPSSCPDCSADAVLLQNFTFSSGMTCECRGATSITIGSGVIIEDGATVTFITPRFKASSEARFENGSRVVIKQN